MAAESMLLRHTRSPIGFNVSNRIVSFLNWASFYFAVIAGHMRRGRQEDSHEFLRYAIDALQKSCLAGHSTLVFPFVLRNTFRDDFLIVKLTLRSRKQPGCIGFSAESCALEWPVMSAITTATLSTVYSILVWISTALTPFVMPCANSQRLIA